MNHYSRENWAQKWYVYSGIVCNGECSISDNVTGNVVSQKRLLKRELSKEMVRFGVFCNCQEFFFNSEN